MATTAVQSHTPSHVRETTYASPVIKYNPALALFAKVSAAWVFVLVTLGAFTTSIGAGMAFSGWPLSNGSINPDGWLKDIAMFAEHSHRLSGTTMGLLTITLAIWLQRVEPRRWLRRLGWIALALVIIQGIIGGQRVLLDALHVPGFEMTLGQMLRIPHGILAQVFVCILFAIAASVSRSWVSSETKDANPSAIRWIARIATVLLFIQLAVAASMRHNYAGLAIPTFPLTPDGELIPAHWDFRVALNFSHRALALIITVALITLVFSLWRNSTISRHLKNAGMLIALLLVVQLTLGAASIWTFRNPTYTTAHVVCGASLLAATFTLTWWLHKNQLDGSNRKSSHSAPLAT